MMATTRSLWCMLCVFYLTVQYTDSITEPNNTIINVTGYLAWGEDLTQTIIVVSNATWFDAVEECKALQGYMTLSGPFGVPFVYIRKQLFIHFQELIGEPLWIGFHKPNLDGVWYIGTDCGNPLDKTSYNTFDNDDATKRQCVLLNTTTNPSNIDFSWYAASCHERHSFICTKYLGKYLLFKFQIFYSI
ncbi:uncharacterized protein LOC117328914 [Pecten maximus]|uniref:uncharacterized protein LOC117328914 n=1 Tax=Pecten maximus TaxID=6579 RepID=UPI001457EC63|nr:uncharacterized protein LOC117328914 [Pecten maximus]